MIWNENKKSGLGIGLAVSSGFATFSAMFLAIGGNYDFREAEGVNWTAELSTKTDGHSTTFYGENSHYIEKSKAATWLDNSPDGDSAAYGHFIASIVFAGIAAFIFVVICVIYLAKNINCSNNEPQWGR